MSAQPQYENVDYSHNSEQENQALADQITQLAGHINAANYRFLKLVAEFDRRGGWAGAGVRSCAHWLSWQCGLELGAARQKVRVARKLEELPKINAAFATGRLSYSVVRAITRVATPATEDQYLHLTEWATASQIEKLARKHRWAQRLQEKNREEIQNEDRRATFYVDDDGMWVITARLPAAEGELVAKTLQAIVDSADAELHQHGITGQETGEDAPPAVTMPQKRADALCRLAEHYVAGDAEALKDLKGAERCQVMLHVDLKTLQAHSDKKLSADHNHCCIGEDNWLHPNTARRLSCDASLVTVLENDKGKVLNIGRRSRIIPPSIQRALDIRDTGCRFPGCDCQQYTDAHHIRHWADGGETRLDNLVKLCRFHHRKLHQGEFTVTAHPDYADDFLFRNRQGDEIAPVRSPQFSQQNGSAEPFSAQVLELERFRPEAGSAEPEEISAETCKTRWMGETMDEGWVVGLLMAAEERAGSADPRECD
jgi:hypothetical protein